MGQSRLCDRKGNARKEVLTLDLREREPLEFLAPLKQGEPAITEIKPSQRIVDTKLQTVRAD